MADPAARKRCAAVLHESSSLRSTEGYVSLMGSRAPCFRASRGSRNPGGGILGRSKGAGLGAWVLCAWAVLAGCMVGPDYRRPDVEVPETWRFPDEEARDVANTAWWEQFGDPVLDELISIALAENKDVKIAAARVEQYLGQLGTTRAALFPQVSAGGSAGRQMASRRTGPSPLELNPNVNATFSAYEVLLSAKWEIDIWGKIRRATEAARAALLSTEEARRAVLLTLVTSVAGSYVNLRDLDKQLDLTTRTAERYKETYDLFSLRFRYGIVSETDVKQAAAQYEQAMANIPSLQKAIAQQENALSVLLGRNPGPIPRGKTLDELHLPAVPAGLPSDLLLNRPDIRQAEASLVAANADIGAAKAQYFPTVSLTGLFGFASMDLSTLFSGPGQMWNYAVPVSGPIFTAGAIKGQVRAAKAVEQQALLRYQQVIQTAFREVDDSLVDQQRTAEQLAALARETEALEDYVRLSRLRYDNGYSSYLDVLYAETLLFDVEIFHAQVQGARFQALVNLYKSMGGGWVVEAENRVPAGDPAASSP